MSIASSGTPYVTSRGPARSIAAWITAKVRRSICGVTSAAHRSGVIAVRSSTARQCSGLQGDLKEGMSDSQAYTELFNGVERQPSIRSLLIYALIRRRGALSSGVTTAADSTGRPRLALADHYRYGDTDQLQCSHEQAD